MKTTFKSILLATLGVFAFTCCEDVPAPYQLPGTGDKPQESSFYSSTSCADWSMLAAGVREAAIHRLPDTRSGTVQLPRATAWQTAT